MLKIIRKNIWLIIKLEFVLSIIVYITALLLGNIVLNCSLKLTDLSYINQANVIIFIKNPLVVIGLFFVLYIISMITIFEINAINIVYIKSKKDETMTIIELIQSTIVNSFHMFKSKNILLFIYIVIFLPLAGVVYKNSLIEKLSIPSFILDYVYQSTKLTTILAIVYLLVFLMSLLSIYIFIVMLTEKKNYFQALRRSIMLFNEKKTKLIPSLLFKGIFIVAIVFLIHFLQILILKIVMNIDAGAFKIFVTTTSLIVSLLLGMFITAFVKVDMLYIVNESYFSNNQLPELKEVRKREIRVPKVIIVILTALIITLLSFVVYVFTYLLEPTDMAVIAHRGSSIVELENTKEAFVRAMDEGVKYIELDVVETKDKQIVIIHDLNLKRLAKVDKKISDLTWSVIKDLTICSDDKSKVGHIMLLKDLVAMVKRDVILNIELKPNGSNDEELSSLVEDIIANYPRHMICSFSQRSLKKIKDINPNRKVGLIMAVALGNYEEISYIDFYSVEETFITEDSVAKIHENGKQVFAWTVNDSASIPDYLDYKVDGIITDYPTEMIKAIQEVKNNFTEYMLEKLFMNER